MLRRIAHPQRADGAEMLEFDSCTLSLGEISEDCGSVQGSFSFVNHSPEAIVLLRATASCSCVVVDYPKEPIESGARARVDFRYYPKGYAGAINRRILLYTSLSEQLPSALLQIEGYTTPSADVSSRYPYPMGQLKLRQAGVTFRGGDPRAQVERIAAINDGTTPLRLRVMQPLPAGLSFTTDPEVIPAGESGDLVIAFDPSRWSELVASYPIIIDGLSVAPSRRTIYVKFEN